MDAHFLTVAISSYNCEILKLMLFYILFQGKVDASVNVKIHRNRRLKNDGSISRQELDYLLPLEVKTGKMFSKNGKILPLVSRLKCLDIFVDRCSVCMGKSVGHSMAELRPAILSSTYYCSL